MVMNSRLDPLTDNDVIGICVRGMLLGLLRRIFRRASKLQQHFTGLKNLLLNVLRLNKLLMIYWMSVLVYITLI